jgi:dTDP-4-dehydrorhamnose reductase
MKKILLVGGDSRLAKVFYNMYKNDNTCDIWRTTRNKIKNKKIIYLDLSNISSFNQYSNFKQVVIIGGVVDYNICEKHYNYAKQINCRNIPKLIENFLKFGSHVVFISTNTVFKFKNKLPNEKSKTCPGFKYAYLKDLTEKKIFRLKKEYKSISILRLTKNLDKKTTPINKWLINLRKNKSIVAFKDLYFAPILYSDSAAMIRQILKRKKYGIFHLSGEKDLSYCFFAELLIEKLKKNKNLLSCKLSKDLNYKLIYNHDITALDMKYTKVILKTKPIKINSVIDYLIN